MSCSMRISVMLLSSSSSRSVSATRSPRESPEAGSSSSISFGSVARAIADLQLTLLAVGDVPDERRRAWPPGRRAWRARGRARASRCRRPCGGAGAGGPSRDAEHGEVEVVLHAQAQEQPRLLVRPAHARAGRARRRRRRRRPSPGTRRSRRSADVARDDVEQRRLPGAVGTEDRAALTARDVEIDVAHGVQSAEPPADPAQAQDRSGRLCDDIRHVVASSRRRP